MSDATTAAVAGPAADQTPEFPMARAAGCPFDPPPELRRLAADRPLARVRIWDGSTPWIVTGHAVQRSLLGDPRVSVDERLPGFPHWNEGMAAGVAHRPSSVFNSDAPEHTRYRRMMTSPFTFKRVEALRPAVQKITDNLIDAMLSGPQPADLVEALALPLPTLVISELLGVPYEDHEFFKHHATVAVDRYASAEQGMQSFRAMGGYFFRLVEAKAAEPADDVISDIAARVSSGEITAAEASMMAVGLFVAGHETSANMIALGTLALLQNPEQLALLRDAGAGPDAERDVDPDGDPTANPDGGGTSGNTSGGTKAVVVADAVEELLRYLTIIHGGQRRIAKEDIEIGGEVIRAGEGIIIELAIANRDPLVFPEPDRLDLGREGARQHNAFGFGIHQCIGQQLARVELQTVFGTLYRRIPTLRLASGLDDVEFKHDRLAYGVYQLPVTW